MSKDESKYQLFWSNLKSHVKSQTPKIVKEYVDRLKSCASKHYEIYEYDEESQTRVLRNDLLAHAFAKGSPSFKYKERPECANMLLEEKVVSMRKRSATK